jgi:S-DNA-T family DNA segregation ATPase FtsK/SpoIIIE
MAKSSSARPKKYKTKVKFKLKTESLQSLFALVCFALAGLTLLSFIGQAAGVGNTMQYWVDTSVGWAAFLVPIVLLSAGLTFSRIRWGIAKLNVLLGLIIILIVLASLLHPISHLFSNLDSLSRAQQGIGGGVVGYTLFSSLSQFVTPLGAWFILLLIFLAGWLIMLNTSIATLFNSSTEAASSTKKTLAGVGSIVKRDKKDETTPGFAINDGGVAKTATPTPLNATPKMEPKAPVNSTQILQNAAGEHVIWDYPPLSLLSSTNTKGDPGDLKGNASTIEKTLESFGIQAKVVEVNIGPTVTQYALELASGTKISKITTLANDLALAVAAKSGAVRVEAPIPGKSLVGIEIPNVKQAMVGLRGILESDEAKQLKSRLILPLGQGVSGHAVAADLTKMPHLLVAGSTGSGKSVAINAFISSLLFHNSPEELKMILVDPKFVELTGYNGIPHLIQPVLTENDKVVSALKWATSEMDRRYKALAAAGARNIEAFNENAGFQALPYIVIIIDELSDLMMTAPGEVEESIVRIAQKARAVGIHLILATQRPSSDIITGLIKANIPARIAFNVSSNVDSRVIMDQPGAEKLLGRGDMLFMAPDASKPSRIQGNMITDTEITKLLDFIKAQGVAPQYNEEVVTQSTASFSAGGGTGGGDRDPMFDEAVQVIRSHDRASASLLQRRLKVGYARAARILDELEEANIVGPGEGSKPREVFVENANQYLGGSSSAPMDEVGGEEY